MVIWLLLPNPFLNNVAIIIRRMWEMYKNELVTVCIAPRMRVAKCFELCVAFIFR